MSKETIYLVDGTSICYRSFYAIRLSTSRGFPTGAIYGFFNTLRKFIKKYNPTYLGVCFDVSRKTFRQEKFKKYKIHRPPVPDGLKLQIPIIKNLIMYLGIKVIEKEGFEADDLIASLTKKMLQNDFKVMIISSDKDVFQLVKNGVVCIYDPVKDTIYNEKEFMNKYGFSPIYITDYLALVGDPTDNIPGAKGIGKMGASKLIKSFGSLENIFNCLDKVSPSLRESLIQNKDVVFLSKELAQLAEPELDFSYEELKIKEADYSQIYKLFNELGFKSLLRDIPAPALNIGIEIEEGISSKYKERIHKQGELFFYINEEDVYIFACKEPLIFKVNLEEIKDILTNKAIKKISYDFKEIICSLKNKCNLAGIYFDVMIAAYLVNSSLADFGIENLISCFLNIFTKDIPPATMPYFIFELYKFLKKEISRKGLGNLFFEVEMPLIEVLAETESWGIALDKEVLLSFSKEVETNLGKVEEEIFRIVGRKFNLNSPQQLRKILFEELKIAPIKRTKTGFSTDEEVLAKLAEQYPIAQFILKYRELSKLKSTYLAPFLKAAESGDGRLHAEFNQLGTQTGRLRSLSPNLQNIPAKNDFSRGVRKAFISSFGEGLILSCDYSQIELRVLAHFSEDEALLKAFMSDGDVHTYTASLLFGIPGTEVAPYQREIAKRVNFGIIYGMSPYGLAKELGISTEEASSFIESYFLRYSKVKEFIEKIYSEAEKTGHVKTILGRIRYLEGIHSSNHELKEFAYRQAINSPIQGSAADIIKMAMVTIYRELKKQDLSSKIIMQIHDELVFDVRKEELEYVKKIAKDKMENVIKLRVPLKVNVKVGKNWLELENVKV